MLHSPHPNEIAQKANLCQSDLAHQIRLSSAPANTARACLQRERGEVAAFAPRLPCAPAARLQMPDSGGRAPVYSTAWSLDGQMLVAASQGGDIRVWRRDDSGSDSGAGGGGGGGGGGAGEQAANLTVHGDYEARDVQWTVTSTAFSPDSRHLLYTSLHDTLYLIDLSRDRDSYGSYSGHYHERGGGGSRTAATATKAHTPLSLSSHGGRRSAGACFSAVWSAGGTEILCGMSSRLLIIYDVDRGEVTGRIPAAHGADLNSVAYASRWGSDADILISGSDDSTLRVYDRRLIDSSTAATSGGASGGSAAAGKDATVAVLRGHLAGVTSVAARGDGRYFASNGKDQCVKLWDLRKPGIQRGDEPTPRSVTRVRAYLDQELDIDYRWQRFPAHLVACEPRDASLATFRGHTVFRTLIRLQFSPAASTGGRFIVTGSADGNVHCYDILDGEAAAVLPHRGHIVREAAMHPELPLLACAAFDGTVHVWDYKSETAAVHRGMKRQATLKLAAKRAACRQAPAESSGSSGSGSSGCSGSEGAAPMSNASTSGDPSSSNVWSSRLRARPERAGLISASNRTRSRDGTLDSVPEELTAAGDNGFPALILPSRRRSMYTGLPLTPAEVAVATLREAGLLSAEEIAMYDREQQEEERRLQGVGEGGGGEEQEEDEEDEDEEDEDEDEGEDEDDDNDDEDEDEDEDGGDGGLAALAGMDGDGEVHVEGLGTMTAADLLRLIRLSLQRRGSGGGGGGGDDSEGGSGER